MALHAAVTAMLMSSLRSRHYSDLTHRGLLPVNKTQWHHMKTHREDGHWQDTRALAFKFKLTQTLAWVHVLSYHVMLMLVFGVVLPVSRQTLPRDTNACWKGSSKSQKLASTGTCPPSLPPSGSLLPSLPTSLPPSQPPFLPHSLSWREETATDAERERGRERK